MAYCGKCGSKLADEEVKVCPACGATTMPDAGGCCEYCGSPVR